MSVDGRSRHPRLGETRVYFALNGTRYGPAASSQTPRTARLPLLGSLAIANSILLLLGALVEEADPIA
jgi:hypothetical protein